MRFKMKGVSVGVLAALAVTAVVAENNPYDKVGDGVPTVSVSSESLVKKVNKNTLDISSNATAISNNEARISVNESSISQNSAAISKNSADIAQNATNISKNASNISINATNISDNASRITQNRSLINTNKNDIATLQGRVGNVEDDLRTVNDRLRDHDNILKDHEERLSDVEEEVANGGGGTPEWQVVFTGNETGSISIPTDIIEMRVTYKRGDVNGTSADATLYGSDFQSFGTAIGEIAASGCNPKETVAGALNFSNGSVSGYSQTKEASCTYTYSCGEDGSNTCSRTRRGNVNIMAAITEVRVLK
ncbi:hypothetical protein [Vibrio agarivorans]|uniref:Uncharacterized protein n=1 Tax=Vibrio agarivorans TaxID=153622 RepID=A0ABT7Y756_9VIBR|nr:hypothetical protein [Vibrio agarivorans]MDN2483884.1 hypothetical protein [Vibrio agarivorans]